MRPVAEEADACTVRGEILSFNMNAKSLAESFDKLRSWNISFHSFKENGCGASSLKKNFFLFSFMSINTGGISVTNVRKFSEDGHCNFITTSTTTTC